MSDELRLRRIGRTSKDVVTCLMVVPAEGEPRSEKRKFATFSIAAWLELQDWLQEHAVTMSPWRQGHTGGQCGRSRKGPST